MRGQPGEASGKQCLAGLILAARGRPRSPVASLPGLLMQEQGRRRQSKAGTQGLRLPPLEMPVHPQGWTRTKASCCGALVQLACSSPPACPPQSPQRSVSLIAKVTTVLGPGNNVRLFVDQLHPAVVLTQGS